jgi:phospholipid/cholesterol/gamma-HCH transport system substrate-binding protein
MKRAIKTHSVDFVAILVLVVLAIVVSGYVLSHERLRFPFIESSPYTLNADFSTGQAVMPGQGQTVRVSGVQIGEVGAVTLKNGVAVVQLNIDSKYKNVVHKDWTALLRPKTGLKDMFIEMQPPPGGSQAPVAPQGFTLPVSNTNPDINPDEVLASLDGDTRAYLDLLVNGAGQGLKGQGGSELAKLLERFLPTHRDLARLNQVVAQRGSNLRRLINSLQVLNTGIAVKRAQLVQLVDASSKVFKAFANANQGVSQAVADLPGTLRQTTQTLQKVQTFANIVAPATRNLLPAVRAIPAANNATVDLAKPITPVLKTEIRPFVVAARPLVRNLRPASNNLSKATPNFSKVFGVLNHLFNDLGYSPGGGQHGYLWWLAWLNHNARTLFSVQDANGDFRPLFLQASCASLAQIAQGIPGSEAVYALTSILTSANTCPAQAAANASAFSRVKQQQGSNTTAGSTLSGAGSQHLFLPKLPTR